MQDVRPREFIISSWAVEERRLEPGFVFDCASGFFIRLDTLLFLLCVLGSFFPSVILEFCPHLFLRFYVHPKCAPMRMCCVVYANRSPPGKMYRNSYSSITLVVWITSGFRCANTDFAALCSFSFLRIACWHYCLSSCSFQCAFTFGCIWASFCIGLGICALEPDCDRYQWSHDR
jgi:hypothetical protein